MSIYILYHVKQWVDGCGGKTDIALIPNVGEQVSFMPWENVQKFEKYSADYDNAVKSLLVEIPKTPKDAALFNSCIEAAKNKLNLARTAFQEYEDTMREVAAQLGISYEEFMKTAEDGVNEFLGKKH